MNIEKKFAEWSKDIWFVRSSMVVELLLNILILKFIGYTFWGGYFMCMVMFVWFNLIGYPALEYKHKRKSKKPA